MYFCPLLTKRNATNKNQRYSYGKLMFHELPNNIKKAGVS